MIRGLLDWIDLTPEQLATVSGVGEKRAATLAHSFAGARQRPFSQWLRALGVAASATGDAHDWATLSARDSADWQAQAGIGATRAQQMVEFFQCPDVQAQAQRLRATGVAGF